MDFINPVFPIFLTIVFIVYWFVLSRSYRMQNILLLFASYVFYGWWDWRFLLLILLTSFSTFYTAILIDRCRVRSRIYLWNNIILNIAILVVFKYLNFFGENLSRLVASFGWNLDWVTLDILLPVGISFYTFQAIGYSVDVYNQRVKPCRDIIDFFTFIAYFPQLVAGPIERAGSLLTQIQRSREWSYREAVRGLRLILIGVVKKLCLADTLSIYSDRIFCTTSIDAVHVAVGAIIFSLIIYFDFSAYSEIAKGVSSLFGITLMKNFNLPYLSRNVVEFWSRWHISLMQWFRDYIYIPLGGSRHGTLKTIRNTFIVFLVSGLWHGAAWNFVIWGVYWAVVYSIGKFVFSCGRPSTPVGVRDLPNIVVTCAFCFFGFYIFRCDDVEQIIAGVRALWFVIPLTFALWLIAKFSVKYPKVAVSAAAILCSVTLILLISHYDYLLKLWWMLPFGLVFFLEWRGKDKPLTVDAFPHKRVLRWLIYYAAMVLIILSEPIDMKFIYFQF